MNCFYQTEINGVMIPSQIKRLEFGTFRENSKLRYITFQEDSRLQDIYYDSLEYSGITSFSFPPKVKFFHKDTFSQCYSLEIIEINDYSKLNTFNKDYVIHNKKAIVMISAKIANNFDLNPKYEEDVPKKSEIGCDVDLCDLFG